MGTVVKIKFSHNSLQKKEYKIKDHFKNIKPDVEVNYYY